MPPATTATPSPVRSLPTWAPYAVLLGVPRMPPVGSARLGRWHLSVRIPLYACGCLAHRRRIGPCSPLPRAAPCSSAQGRRRPRAHPNKRACPAAASGVRAVLPSSQQTELNREQGRHGALPAGQWGSVCPRHPPQLGGSGLARASGHETCPVRAAALPPPPRAGPGQTPGPRPRARPQRLPVPAPGDSCALRTKSAAGQASASECASAWDRTLS